MIGGIVKSRIAGKWCEEDAELGRLFALIRKRSEHIETKKQGKKYVRQICFILTLEEFNKCYYRLSEMEGFSLTYSCMIVSYSGYPEGSVSNQFSAMETSNTNKRKLLAKSSRPIEHSFRKELQQKIQTDNRPPRQILDGIDKENDAVFEESSTEVNIKQIYNYRLSNDSNSLDPYTERHSFEKLHFVRPENLQ